MNVLSLNSVSKAGRESLLFSNVTFGLEEGEKVALIGKNGTGKSTLLSCIAGKLEPDNGSISINNTAEVSFLSQNPKYNPNETILEHIFHSNSVQLQTIKQYEAVCSAIAENADTKLSQSLQSKFEALSLTMDDLNLWNYEFEVRSVLDKLGITNLEQKMGVLSGGMAKKVALAQVLIDDTKLLLLDEPTNHLDISTIAWLERWLMETKRTVLMVTHDRYFLDAVCTSIYELDRKTITLYTGNFSTFLEKKAVFEEIAQNTDAKIESVLRTEREWLKRGPQARGTKAKARIDSIHRMINRERFTQDEGFSFEVTGRRLGGRVLDVDSISKSWDGEFGEKLDIIKNFSYMFCKGEKIGIFGVNGSGKSTLLGLLTGVLKTDSGVVTKGENTVISYYQQNPHFSDADQTVLEYVKEIAENITLSDGKILSASQLLENFGFEGRVQYSPITTLSGGERKRVYLVRLLIANPNFLILDEPTNDFDIYTLSVLEAFLENYAGCLLVVSHDRYFMDRVVNTLFILEGDGSISGFVGSCSEYIALKESTTENKNVKKLSSVPKNSNTPSQEIHKEDQKKIKRSFKEQKEFESIEDEISAIEEKKGELEAIMSSESQDHEKIRLAAIEYEKITIHLEEKYKRWEYLASFD